MAIFTAIASAIGTAIGLAGTALTIFTAVGASVLSIGVSSLLIRRLTPNAPSGNFGGGRVQLPPATDNKIPVVYGSAFIGGPVIDAKISTNLKTMWYVVALAEHTDTTAGSGYTYDMNNIYYDGKKVQFASPTSPNVTGLINNTPGQTEIDTKVNGKIFIYLYRNGSSGASGQNTSGVSAIQILQDGAIPLNQRWTSTDTMTNCAFAIVRVNYDDKAGTTSLGGLMCRMSNSLTRPGSAIKDYMLNTRYGCAIPLSRIDTASLTALDTYSDELINYGAGTQERYRINGPLQTGENCLNNLQYLTDSCDSWLQYSELTAKWKVVINQSYTDYATINDLFLVDSSNLIGGINISPINLNDTFNQLEVAYPNKYIKDQTDYQVVELDDYAAAVMSPNEAVNKLNISYPIVNNSIQALYLGVRKLLQSREDLTVTFKLDYSGIQIEAGDVIRIKHEEYGWDVLNSGDGKLFRVATVAEEKYSDGSLGVFITAFEYNDTIYNDRALLDFQPDPNTGLPDPNIYSNVAPPIVKVVGAGTIPYFEVTGTVPVTGLVRYLDFNYGFNSDVTDHVFYQTITNSNGEPLLANAQFTIQASDIPAGDIYWSLTAKNDQVGENSTAVGPFSWGGPTVSSPNTFSPCNAFSSGNTITSDAIANLYVGGLVTKISGTGTLVANTRVTNVISSTQFTVTPTPSVALSNACISITGGGISGNNIQQYTIINNNIANNTITNVQIANNTITFNNLSNTLYSQTGIGEQGWQVSDDTIVTLPINVTARTSFDQPIYLIGTNPGASYRYPYFQGTSTTANGYVQNSTGVFTPANAVDFQRNDGDYNWWIMTWAAVANVTLALNESIYTRCYAQFVSPSNATIQVTAVFTPASSPSLYIGDDQFLHTYTLVANEPLFIVYEDYAKLTGGVIGGAGIMFRNLTAGANVIVPFTNLQLFKSKGEPS